MIKKYLDFIKEDQFYNNETHMLSKYSKQHKEIANNIIIANNLKEIFNDIINKTTNIDYTDIELKYAYNLTGVSEINYMPIELKVKSI